MYMEEPEPKRYCTVCGKELIEYPEYKKLSGYSEFTGKPRYYGGYMRCPVNPCHQGHDWEEYGTWKENFKMKLKNFFLFKNLIKCKRCGEIFVSN